MALVDEQILQDKINSHDDEWFNKGGNRSRVKRFFKTKQLDNTLIYDLWNIRTIRYDLISTQKLPKDLIIQVIDNAAKRSRNFTKAMFIETLVKQDIINDEILKHIESLELGLYLITWETIPKTMLQNSDFDKFMKVVSGMNNDFWTYQKERKGSIVSVVRIAPTKLDEIIKFLCPMPPHVSYELISTIAKVVFFSDEVVSFLRSNIDEMTFHNILEQLIKKKNCSINIKARYLLEN